MRTNNNLNPHDARLGNKTQVTVVEGKCSHHCAISVPLKVYQFPKAHLYVN